MTLMDILADRYAATSCKDPDTLHGILLSIETEEQRRFNQRIVDDVMPSRTLLAKARAGEAGRVPAFKGREPSHSDGEALQGLFPFRWKRELIAGLVSAEGMSTTVMAKVLHECGGHYLTTAKAMNRLRGELRPLGIQVESSPLQSGRFNYRMPEASAVLMRQIIANGWRV